MKSNLQEDKAMNGLTQCEGGGALRLLLLMALVVFVLAGCGATSIRTLPEEERQSLCNELLARAQESFGCGLAELAGGAYAQADASYRATADVTFRPDGRMTHFSRLRLHVEPAVEPNRAAPQCVESLLGDLRVRPRATALTVPISLRFKPGAGASAAALTDGACGLTLPPRGP